MRSWVDIEEGRRGKKSAYCVMMNVRALVMFCGIVQSTVLQEMTLCVSCRSFLEIGLNILRAWIVLKKHLLFLGSELWEDDFSSMLDLVKDYIVDVWELQKARLYDENLSIPQS